MKNVFLARPLASLSPDALNSALARNMRCLDDFGPFNRFRFDQRRKFRRTVADRLETCAQEPLACFGNAQDSDDFAVQLGYDFFGCARRQLQAVPRARFVTRDSRL